MSKSKDKLISEQQTYLDFVTADKPYRKVQVWDKANARSELMILRADLKVAQNRITVLENELEQQAIYSRNMKSIFSAGDRSDEVHAIKNLASYNYFKGAYEALRHAWWIINHPTDDISRL